MNKQRLNKLAGDVITSDLSTDDRRFLARFLEQLSHACENEPDDKPDMTGNGYDHVTKSNRDYWLNRCRQVYILLLSHENSIANELQHHLETKKELANARQLARDLQQKLESLELDLADSRNRKARASDDLPDIEKRFIRTVKPLMTVAQFDLALKLFHLIHFVPPELQDEARELLCGVSST